MALVGEETSSDPVYVVAPRYAALWLLRRVSRAEVRSSAENARLQGRPDVASDLEEFAAQLRLLEVRVSGVGSAEVVEAEVGAGLGCPSSLDTVPAAEAARLLGVTSRRIGHLLADGILSGTKGPGGWVVDRESVDLEVDRRNRGDVHE